MNGKSSAKGLKDHFVSETYQRHFCNESGRVWVYDKASPSDRPKPFYPGAICYTRGGSDNSYFRRDRVVEEYLAEFEPRWPAAVATLVSSQEVSFQSYIE